ncbi:hypothetical protein HPP92_004726 [Vanilla planifolia]|uniref:Uncharacterized protein n=1 Tax=Vanilla planifolia TaxID=51239 RepID=A0A835RSE7_VANPL|nr:hypothetical protein HPP92_004726 [Vanilla planifolia]
MGIFEPYRAIGYITTDVPFYVQRLGTESFVTVSVGKAFQVFNCAKLTLVAVGPQLPKKIRALASYRDYTFAAYGTDIGVFLRAHQVATWSKHKEKVKMLLVFGEYVLSVDVKGYIYIWAFKDIEQSVEAVGHILLEENFLPTCIMHPDTYINKVILGSQAGSLQLWNISTRKKLYEFKGWESSVYCCVSSPALDVVAVGCSDGTSIFITHVMIKRLFHLPISTRGAVTALSFRTDGEPLLASGGSSGLISIWNLEKQRLQSVIRDAHDSRIVSLHFFANEPVLMSSAADNSIKIWIFDTTQGDARLLRFRSGHCAPPLCLRFYKNGRCILSAGQDRAFGYFPSAGERVTIMSRLHRGATMSSITTVMARLEMREWPARIGNIGRAEIRERDWCNVVTCHMDTPKAYVWHLQNFVIGEHILSPSAENQTPVKACAISACGNFAIVGTEGGWIERFNLQSGISQGIYVDNSELNKCAHYGEVVGVACDSTNSVMISAGYHGDVKVWNFRGGKVKSIWKVGQPLTKIVFQRTNGLLATAADDMVLRLFDITTLRMVRQFEGHTDRITDLCFSDDGKWLLSSGMDGSLRIWDVVLARQIDALSVDASITAISLSPAMDILATSHVDHNGVYLCETFGASHFKDEIPELVTLSLLPKSHWQSLTNLDVIKARNKPIEPPKKPEKAPFFLPSVSTLSGQISFKLNEVSKDEKKDMQTQEAHRTRKLDASSPFCQLLQSCADEKDFSAFTDFIKSLPPSTLDVELRVLQIIDEDEETTNQRVELQSIGLLLDYFIHELSRKNNFEFLQAVIRLFLKIHGETVRRHLALQEKAKRLLEVQSSVWQQVYLIKGKDVEEIEQERTWKKKEDMGLLQDFNQATLALQNSTTLDPSVTINDKKRKIDDV